MPDWSWYNSFGKGESSVDEFVGTMYFYNAQGYFVGESVRDGSGSNTMTESDPCPASGGDGTGGGGTGDGTGGPSGGGTGPSTGGNPGNTGSGAGGRTVQMSWLCNAYGQLHSYPHQCAKTSDGGIWVYVHNFT